MRNISNFNRLSIVLVVIVFFLSFFIYHHYIGHADDQRYGNVLNKGVSVFVDQKSPQILEHVSAGYVLTKKRSIFIFMLIIMLVCVLAIGINVYGARITGPTKSQLPINIFAVLVFVVLVAAVLNLEIYKYA